MLHAAQRPAADNRARSEAPASGNDVKAALQRFSLEGPAISGRDAQGRFVRALLACFGWRDGEPPGTEIPATLATREHGKRVTRVVAARWAERRVLIDVIPHDSALDAAWTELLPLCLEQQPVPHYVIVSNQHEVRLYDLQKDTKAPRLTTTIDQIAKYSEAFAPLLGPEWTPGTTLAIVNVGKVSREVADLVARLYRRLDSRFEGRRREVIQFTLQCIITMFAEDIGLLPSGHFTRLLYEGAQHRDVEQRLRALFTQMATRNLPEPRTVAYFNGGLFTKPVTLPLDEEELTALTKAAEQDWRYVDPHIFGSVFQGIMDDAARHASGAHYTAREDIMRIVGPTIIEPWRKRIAQAKTLAQLLEALSDLSKFRVLDPACGSGNFLYVSFTELYSLETQLLMRIHEFPGQSVGWSSGITTLNFYGLDTNEFAIELAKVTLNIAKKIAFEERRQKVGTHATLLEVDPSLPLDNLDRNIICADALFTDWPEVDAIVGNPPFLAGTSISTELGSAYASKLRAAFPAVGGRADLCTFWFRRAHERLAEGGRAGLVATSSIREGNNREAALEYIVGLGATITNAVSSQPWQGEAAVNVSMVNWLKGTTSGPFQLEIAGIVYDLPSISPHLQQHANVATAGEIRANDDARSSKGIDVGTKSNQITAGLARELWRDERSRPYIFPVAQGKQLLGGNLSTEPDYIIDMSRCSSIEEARRGGRAFELLREHKLPEVKKKPASYAGWLDRWWQSWCPRTAFLDTSRPLGRMIVCSKHAARPIYVFVSTKFFVTDSLQMFAFDDDYSFGVLQSSVHWAWTIAKGSKLTDRIRYTMEVWNTFPWPQAPTEANIVHVSTAARELRATRDRLMEANNWTLRALHQAAEVTGPHPLKDAQRALDDAVASVYGIPGDLEITEFLLELNQCVVEDEAAGTPVTGPGLPPGYDPKDPRWHSDDCIQPPSLSE
ncbi:MAG: type IIL restriction-modification enzyme MmeI [Polyangiales bacterium]